MISPFLKGKKGGGREKEIEIENFQRIAVTTASRATAIVSRILSIHHYRGMVKGESADWLLKYAGTCATICTPIIAAICTMQQN